jgi:leucyl/phenylalanyl-tRNA--protein transferase
MSADFVFNPRLATEEGLVAIGGELTAQRLLSAYQSGVFPWPHEGLPMLWFSLDPRGVIDFDKLKVNRSLKKFLNKKPNWTVTRNMAFREVIQACARQPRPGQNGTWITEEVIEAYSELHRQGVVHSIEVWEGSVLVGGIYGVRTGRYFSAESMFHQRDNASKVAFIECIQWLKAEGQNWMDLQMITPSTEALGGQYISREDFLQRIGV